MQTIVPSPWFLSQGDQQPLAPSSAMGLLPPDSAGRGLPTCPSRVIRDLAIQPQRRPLSVVSPIATRMLRCRERSDVPEADIVHLVRNERGRQPRRPLSYTVAPIRRGQLAASMSSERWAIEDA